MSSVSVCALSDHNRRWKSVSFAAAAELTEIYGSRAGEVLTAKPDLSGLWQISGRNRLSAAERCRLDLECVRNKSVGMYFRIMVGALPELLTGESAW